jgi:hypothetical protein
MQDGSVPDVSVTVFCRNEVQRIGACIGSVAAAAEGLRTSLTVIANGSTDGSAAAAAQAARAHGLASTIYTIRTGDKAHAINQSLGPLRRPAGLYVFVDGYCIISPAAFTSFIRALADAPHALAATGVSGNGRTMKRATAETIAQGGLLHGQLHALRPGFIDRMAAGGLRLPIGLYRGDGLLGSMACHALDPVGHPWDGHRIAGVAEATYAIEELSPLRPSHISRQFRRKVRQMRGVLENAAIRAIIYTHGYQGLPEYADDMITGWLARGGRPEFGVGDWPFMALAMRQIARGTRPAARDLQATVFATTGPSPA